MQLPIKARITEFKAVDGVGTVETSDGQKLRFGASACIGFLPAEGLQCFVIATKPDPLRKGATRAAVLNLTGAAQADRLTQAQDANKRSAEFEAKEQALLARFGFGDDDEVTHHRLMTLNPEQQDELAAALMEMKRAGHFFDDLFTKLVETEPGVFDRYLDELDPKREPESIAFTFAPAERLGRFIALLDAATEGPKAVQLQVGHVAPALEAHRDSRAAANDVAGAVIALARSGTPLAREALARWARKATAEDANEVNPILLTFGRSVRETGALVTLVTPVAQAIVPVPRGTAGVGTMWRPLSERCVACKSPLLEVARVPADELMQTMTETTEIRVVTCRRCVPFAVSPFFVEFGENDGVSHALDEVPADFEPPMEPQALAVGVTAVQLVPAPMTMSYFHAETSRLNRVGGVASWVQGPELPFCPICQGPMRFVAQFADPPGTEWSGDLGMLYAFWCAADRVGATITQCS